MMNKIEEKAMSAEENESINELSRVVLNNGVRSEELQCHWRSWRVVGPRSLAVDFPPDNRGEMLGTIRVAEVLMPNVLEIHTFCDGAAGYVYARIGGRWSAFET